MKEQFSQHSSQNKISSFRRIARMAYNGELTMPFYPPVQEDQNREEGMPSIADKFGGDVIVMRVGSKPLSKATIQLAAKAIRSSKRHS